MGKKNENTSATQQVAEVKTVEKVVEKVAESIQSEETLNDSEILKTEEISEKPVEPIQKEETENLKTSLDELKEQESQTLELKVNDAEILKKETPVEINDLTFELDGEKYTFTSDCPEKLQIDNKVYLVKNLVTNQEILNSLVVGESAFVKKL